MLYEFHLHVFKRGRLRPLLLPVPLSPTQVRLQVTYLLQHLHALPHQARCHPPGVGQDAGLSFFSSSFLFGVTVEPGLGSLVLVLQECMYEPGFRPMGLLA